MSKEPKLIAVVIAKVQEDLAGGRWLGEAPACKLDGCDEPAHGLDGLCIPHSREAERTGQWETIPLETQDPKGAAHD